MAKKRQLDADAKSALAFLKRPDPLLTIVLKGHLLAEERLNRLLVLFAKAPGHLPNNLRFHQKLRVVRANAPLAMSDARVWDLLDALNSIRNQMAHSLDPSKIEAHARALWTKYGPDTPFGPEPDGPANRVEQTVAFALGYLAGIEVATAIVLDASARQLASDASVGLR